MYIPFVPLKIDPMDDEWQRFIPNEPYFSFSCAAK